MADHFPSGPCYVNNTFLCPAVVRPGEGRSATIADVKYPRSSEFLVLYCNAPPQKKISQPQSCPIAFPTLAAGMHALLPCCHNWRFCPLLVKSSPRLNWCGGRCRPQLGEPLSGIWCSSAAPHYLAGLCKVPAEVPNLALALGREFFVHPAEHAF